MSLFQSGPIAQAILHAYYDQKLMELTLNLVWVGVAVAGIVLQWMTLSRASRSSDQSASTRQKIVAMGCALVILFFVISMTDDLHNQQVLVEERKGSRIVAAMVAPASSASARTISTDFLLFLPPAAFSLSLFAASWLLQPFESRFPATVEQQTICGRAPPLSLI